MDSARCDATEIILVAKSPQLGRGRARSHRFRSSLPRLRPNLRRCPSSLTPPNPHPAGPQHDILWAHPSGQLYWGSPNNGRRNNKPEVRRGGEPRSRPESASQRSHMDKPRSHLFNATEPSLGDKWSGSTDVRPDPHTAGSAPILEAPHHSNFRPICPSPLIDPQWNFPKSCPHRGTQDKLRSGAGRLPDTTRHVVFRNSHVRMCENAAGDATSRESAAPERFVTNVLLYSSTSLLIYPCPLALLLYNCSCRLPYYILTPNKCGAYFGPVSNIAENATLRRYPFLIKVGRSILIMGSATS